MNHDRILWVLQWVLGLYFILFGMIHFLAPEGLPGPMEWIYDLDQSVHVVAGLAEILGGLGLILPSLTRIRPELTPLAALGLIVIMAAAAVWHIGREEFIPLGINVVDAVLLAYVAYGRRRLAPMEAR